MARRRRKALRIAGWIIGGFLSLILLITLVFYLGRGYIMKRAVEYVNTQQPGEVTMRKMNLIPFMNFPDVSLQLRNVNYYEKPQHPDSLYNVPILNLNEIYVTLDIIELIRGVTVVSEARLRNGFLRVEIYEDSVTNLEKALGIRLGEGSQADTTEAGSTMKLDLKQLALSNILLLLEDRSSDNKASVQVHSLESSITYFPDIIEAGVNLNMELNYLNYLTYNSETPRSIELSSSITMDPERKLLELRPSSLEVSGLQLETWGTYAYMYEPYLDLEFEARNEGLEVLNHIFRGVLDLDEIEQIGSGTIQLKGSVTGTLENNLPEVRVEGRADRIGFNISSIDKNVSDISFQMYATNGTELDFSEASLILEGFTATFPEGTINSNIIVNNAVLPEVDVQLTGDIELDGLEQILETDLLDELTGRLRIEGDLKGTINKEQGEFLEEGGALFARLDEVGFNLLQDSGRIDSIRDITGDLFLRDSVLGTPGLQLRFNNNPLLIESRTENLLLYLLGFERDVDLDVMVSSEFLNPGSMLSDTTLSSLLGDQIEGLHFSAGVAISKEDLDLFLQKDSIPQVHFTLDSFGVELPVYASIEDVNASMTLSKDSLKLQHFQGTVGSSRFLLSGAIGNYQSLFNKDSGEFISLDYALSSHLMLAEDLLTYKDEFLLPETYHSEYLEDFRIEGSLELPVEAIVHDSVSMNFELEIADLGWNFRYYPLAFEDFHILMSRHDNALFIEEFQGSIGESNLKLNASIANFNDTLIENVQGSLVLESDLLDFNQLLNYQPPRDASDTSGLDSAEMREPPRLDQIKYPNVDFSVDIKELRYADYKIFGLDGRLRSTKEKIFYLDHLATSAESGGYLEFTGMFNVANPYLYTFSAELDLEDVSVNDLDFELQSGEETFTLKDNFNGLISAEGLAEIFITPDLKVDMSSTTAFFDVQVKDGAIFHFSPLQAAAKYLDTRDLDSIQFDSLQNRFTLVDSRIQMPLMNVESTIGQLLIQGEQGLDNSYLYLVYVPMWLVRGAARSMLSSEEQTEEERRMYEMERGKFLVLTAWGDGVESEVRTGDDRDRYLE